MKRPLVFLDFDGVLNSQKHWQRREPVHDGKVLMRCAARAHVDVLNQIVRRARAAIVVSSAWRCGMSVARLRRLLRGSGVDGHVLGKTPDLSASRGAIVVPRPRGEEIDTWRREHGHVGPFVILDDDADMAPHMDRLVQTSFATGLTWDHLGPALEQLGRQP